MGIEHFAILEASDNPKFAGRDVQRALEETGRVILLQSWPFSRTQGLKAHLKMFMGIDIIRTAPCRRLGNDLHLRALLQDLHLYPKSLLVLDGFEDIHSSEIRNEICEIFKTHRGKPPYLLLTSTNTEYLRPLTFASPFIAIRTPSSKHLIPHFFMSNGRSLEAPIFQGDSWEIKYHSPILSTPRRPSSIIAPKEKKIIIPSQRNIIAPGEKAIITSEEKRIITEVAVIEKNILKLVSQNPFNMLSLQAGEFEDFVAELYRALGFEVVQTKRTRDGGKDFIISNKTLLGDQLIFGQCKRYSRDRPISIEILRSFSSVLRNEQATAGIMITTSSFTKDSHDYVRKYERHRISLVDFEGLKKLIAKLP